MTQGLVAAASDEAVYVSKTLSKFLSAVYARPAAVLVDLGPAIGSNISFLGERVGCKIHIGDLYADLDGLSGHKPGVHHLARPASGVHRCAQSGAEGLRRAHDHRRQAPG